jgi:hypothetical protein
MLSIHLWHFCKVIQKQIKQQLKRWIMRSKKIESTIEDMQQFYEMMFNDENVYVRLHAISYCGNTKFNTALALCEIKKIRSNSRLTDLDRLSIDYAIERWEKELND